MQKMLIVVCLLIVFGGEVKIGTIEYDAHFSVSNVELKAPGVSALLK